MVPTQGLETIQLLAGIRQDNESFNAVLACNDYLKLGPRRSITKLKKKYDKRYDKAEKAGLDTLESVPRYHRTLLSKWCYDFRWVARAEHYEQQRQKKLAIQDKLVLEQGLSRPACRVEELTSLYNKLTKVLDKDGLYMRDTFTYKGTMTTKKRYNASLINNIRGILDDIARETGGRTQYSDVTVRGLAGLVGGTWGEGEEVSDAVIVSEDEGTQEG